MLSPLITRPVFPARDRGANPGASRRGRARTSKARASPKRSSLWRNVSAPPERRRGYGTSVTSTSAHLRVLGRSRLAATRKHGTRVFYRLAGDDVAAFVVALRDLALSRLAGAGQVVRDYFIARDALEPLTREELVARTSSIPAR